MNYRFAYSIGFHPWEDALEEPPFVETITKLFSREEVGTPPFGRALDLGTGSGIWAVELAKRYSTSDSGSYVNGILGNLADTDSE